jgi:hypothetical protein
MQVNLMSNKPERPYISDSDLVLASMDHKEAREFTGGYDKERIKLMREVKQKLRARNEFDALLDAKKKDADSPSIEEKYLSQKQLERYAIQPNFNGELWKGLVADNKKFDMDKHVVETLNKFDPDYVDQMKKTFGGSNEK